jgi:hypothetical protein
MPAAATPQHLFSHPMAAKKISCPFPNTVTQLALFHKLSTLFNIYPTAQNLFSTL